MKKLYKGMTISLASILMLNPITALAYTKTETVYSHLDYAGSVKKTMVNVGLSKLEKGDILDYSNLEDIKNVNGRETFNQESDKITWKSTGHDIYYQGKISSSLPIEVSAKYYFNGEEVKPSKIKGKSGQIKIVYQLHNNSYDGDSSLYTPFVVTCVSLISEDNNSNVQVTNGKVVHTGNKNIVTAISSPGLYENFDLEQLKNLDTITITYDTSKFALNDTYFVATPKLLEEVDIKKFDKVHELRNSLNTLQNGMNALENGSNELVGGVDTLNNGLSSLNSAIKQALDGSTTITNGLTEIRQGSSKFESLNTLVDTLYSSYQSNLELLNNITSGVTAQQLQAGIQDATEKKTGLENQLAEADAGIKQLEQGESLGVLTEEQTAQLAYLREVKPQLENGIMQYAKGIEEANANLNSLPMAPLKISGANEVISQVLMGVLGVSSMDEVNEEVIQVFHDQINRFMNGVNALEDGSKKLTSGLSEIYDGSNKISSGMNSLGNGSRELSNGISKINNEGIKKISGYGSKLENVSYKVKKLVELSKNYKGFSSDNADTTIFIYKLSK